MPSLHDESSGVSPVDPDQSKKFVLSGCRSLQKNHSAISRIERMIIALESAVYGDPALAFDLSKSLVESACKVILSERGIQNPSYRHLQELMQMTQERLQILPDTFAADGKSHERIRRTLKGLQSTVQGLCELRNNHGYSHGRGEYSTELESIQAELAARSADTIVHFLFSAHFAYPLNQKKDSLQMEDYPEFNEYLDQTHPLIEVFSASFTPSEALFALDPKAYQDALTAFQNNASEMQET